MSAIRMRCCRPRNSVIGTVIASRAQTAARVGGIGGGSVSRRPRLANEWLAMNACG